MVFGELTLYSETGSSANAAKTSVKESIKSDLDDGNFNGVQENVVRVSYVTLSADANEGTSGRANGADPETNVSPQTSLVRVSLFVAAGLMMAILVGIAYKRRRKSEADDAETNELGEQSQVL